MAGPPPHASGQLATSPPRALLLPRSSWPPVSSSPLCPLAASSEDPVCQQLPASVSRALHTPGPGVRVDQLSGLPADWPCRPPCKALCSVLELRTQWGNHRAHPPRPARGPFLIIPASQPLLGSCALHTRVSQQVSTLGLRMAQVTSLHQGLPCDTHQHPLWQLLGPAHRMSAESESRLTPPQLSHLPRPMPA